MADYMCPSLETGEDGKFISEEFSPSHATACTFCCASHHHDALLGVNLVVSVEQESWRKTRDCKGTQLSRISSVWSIPNLRFGTLH
jgi:hypothetical protein